MEPNSFITTTGSNGGGQFVGKAKDIKATRSAGARARARSSVSMRTPGGNTNRYRRENAFRIRVEAATLARERVHPPHFANGDEQRFRVPEEMDNPRSGELSLLGSFTKGLPHIMETGLARSADDFELFVKGADSGNPRDFIDIPLGPQNVPPGEMRFNSGIAQMARNGKGADVRGWESMGAGLTFDLEGFDAQALTMPPAPTLDSDELIAEMTEVYFMALLRDVPFVDFANPAKNALVQQAVNALNNTAWIQAASNPPVNLTDAERSRLRGPIDVNNLFRGQLIGDEVGPFLSQFLLVGTKGIGNANLISDGKVQYGGVRIDQRVRFATPCKDFMTTWEAWLDVQNGANLIGLDSFESKPTFRFPATPRDAATYVHFDALYEAYLNACLIMLDIGVPFDQGIPFQRDDDIDHQIGFAQFGGPHILTLVTEVATRALKAVRFQKFNSHRRLRPEAVGGLIDRFMNKPTDPNVQDIATLVCALDDDLLKTVARHNAKQNTAPDRRNDCMNGHDNSFLLPMAWPEGSPMHPAYGSGHAAVSWRHVTPCAPFTGVPLVHRQTPTL